MITLLKYLTNSSLRDYYCDICVDNDVCDLLINVLLPFRINTMFTPKEMYQIHLAQLKMNDTRQLKWVRTEPGKITRQKLNKKIIKLIEIS